jgi:NAD(P)-dependent dehydrogenase (short-subunit alcohol dehydrogenase family)
MNRLKGKTALVAGGNAGVSSATARQLANEGAYVFLLLGRDPDLIDDLSQLEQIATVVRGDVSNLADLDRLLARIRTNKNKLDVLIAIASTTGIASLANFTEKDYLSMFNEVKGVFFTMQKAIPLLQNGGVIVLNAPTGPNSGLFPSATKGMIRSLARTLAADLTHRDVRVNAISLDRPAAAEEVAKVLAFVASDEGGSITLRDLLENDDAHSFGGLSGELATADDIASAVTFLASDDSSYISGVELRVDDTRRRNQDRPQPATIEDYL